MSSTPTLSSHQVIDEWNAARTGWARFSADRKMRYRLRRLLSPRAINPNVLALPDDLIKQVVKVVFVLLNPSDANAFKPDPTVTNCVKFAQRWGADVLEVVNLFAFRSPYPTDLDAAIARADDLGVDAYATAQILEACQGATRVIAGWGNGGERVGRDSFVRELLANAEIKLMHLGLTKSGAPIHPLARGKHRIPLDREPQEWRWS